MDNDPVHTTKPTQEFPSPSQSSYLKASTTCFLVTEAIKTCKQAPIKGGCSKGLAEDLKRGNRALGDVHGVYLFIIIFVFYMYPLKKKKKKGKWLKSLNRSIKHFGKFLELKLEGFTLSHIDWLILKFTMTVNRGKSPIKYGHKCTYTFCPRLGE